MVCLFCRRAALITGTKWSIFPSRPSSPLTFTCVSDRHYFLLFPTARSHLFLFVPVSSVSFGQTVASPRFRMAGGLAPRELFPMLTASNRPATLLRFPFPRLHSGPTSPPPPDPPPRHSRTVSILKTAFFPFAYQCRFPSLEDVLLYSLSLFSLPSSLLPLCNLFYRAASCASIFHCFAVKDGQRTSFPLPCSAREVSQDVLW